MWSFRTDVRKLTDTCSQAGVGTNPPVSEWIMAEFVDWSRAQPEEAIARAATVLRAGGRVAFPTDTCYEIGALGLDEQAVSKLPVDGSMPLTLAVTSADQMLDWAPSAGLTAVRLGRRCWPGPVTLIAPGERNNRLPAGTLNRLGDALAFRIPAHLAVLEVAQKLEGPLLLAGTSVTDVIDGASPFGEAADLVFVDGPTHFRGPPTVVRVEGARWQLVSRGPVTKEDIEDLLRVHILFVCTGNTCRSPLAEALCTKLLAERLGCSAHDISGRGYVVGSAGLSAYSGGGAAEDAAMVATEFGADLSGHRSRYLTEDMLARADFVFGMTRSHVLSLARANIPGMPPPRLLSGDGQDIPDPIGSDLETYRQCAQTIWKSLQELAPQFENVAVAAQFE